MRILWITNIAMPALCKEMGWPLPVIGAWMYSSLDCLKAIPDCKIAVATVYQGKELIVKKIENITYYLLPLEGKQKNKYNRSLESYWEQIKLDYEPDVVHIHGTEFPHGLAYVKACGNKGVIVSVQGLVSVISRYYTDGIERENLKTLTFRDILRNGGFLASQNSFKKTGETEQELIRSVNHIIGRTEWDKAHCWAINPNAKYHHVGETLRQSFYKAKWTYENCEPHTIFVSQASYPIKGLHMLLKALPLILRQYPDTKIYVAGSDETVKPFWRITAYGKYLKKLINKYNLRNHVVFTGLLSEEKMCEQYLKANIFVCCSAIENSPNSLGEAQMLGMPYLATFAGGIPEIVGMNPRVLYRFEEIEILAKKVCEIFEDYTIQSLDSAVELYDHNKIMDSLLNSYREATL